MLKALHSIRRRRGTAAHQDASAPRQAPFALPLRPKRTGFGETPRPSLARGIRSPEIALRAPCLTQFESDPRLRRETTVSLRRIAGEIRMGAWTHVANLLVICKNLVPSGDCGRNLICFDFLTYASRYGLIQLFEIGSKYFKLLQTVRKVSRNTFVLHQLRFHGALKAILIPCE